MPGKHLEPQPPSEPKIVMHEDDPVLVRHYPTKLTRQNVKRFAVIGAIITFALVLFAGWQLYSQQEQIQRERHDRNVQINTQIRKVACAVVAPYKDRIPYVREFRAEFNCPPYDPDIAKQLQPTAPPSPTPTSTHKYSGLAPIGGKTVLLTPIGQNGPVPSSGGHGSTPSQNAGPVLQTHSASPKPTPTPSATVPTTPVPSPSPTGILPSVIQTLCSIQLVDVLAC